MVVGKDLRRGYQGRWSELLNVHFGILIEQPKMYEKKPEQIPTKA